MFRFSIRDGLLAVPLLAVCFAWLCEKGRVEAKQAEAAKLRLQLREQEQEFSLREAALRAQLNTPRLSNFSELRCGLGFILEPDSPECSDPSLP